MATSIGSPRPDAVLATNTSYLDVNAIARMTTRPHSVVGMHFFSPANVMRLLEVVRGAATTPDVLATAIEPRTQDRQGAGRGRCVPRLRRQSYAAAAHGRGRAAAAGRRVAAGCRRRADRLRLPDGTVRDERSRRPRHFLAHAQGARVARRDRRPAVRARPVRPEDRQGLLSLRARLAHAQARCGGGAADRRHVDAARDPAPLPRQARKSSNVCCFR